MSATLHAWAAAGSPPPPYDAAPGAGPCATCGAETTAGVSLDQIETPTTSGHADLFRFGSQHVCPGCAWLFAAGKGRPGNYIAYGHRPTRRQEDQLPMGMTPIQIAAFRAHATLPAYQRRLAALRDLVSGIDPKKWDLYTLHPRRKGVIYVYRDRCG